MQKYEEFADFSVRYATQQGCSYAEARLEQHIGGGYLLKNGNPELSGFDTATGLGMRIITSNTLGFITLNEFDRERIRDLIDKGIRITKASSKLTNNVKLSPTEVHSKKYSVKQKLKIEDLDPARKLKELIDVDKKINDIQYRYFSLSDDMVRKYFINSEGIKIESEIPRINLFYNVTIKEGNEVTQHHWQKGNVGGFEYFKKWNLDKELRQQVDNLRKIMKHGKKAPSGKMDLVVSSEIAGIMAHESVGHPCEADRIFGREAAQAGESFVTKDMIGNKIGTEIVNVVDDPTLENSYGFYLYDDEGVSARRNYLIKEGRIHQFLHNRETAAAMNLSSNGAARANNYNAEAIVRMSNTFFLPGDYKDEELFGGVKLGVYMKSFNEWNIDDIRLNQKYVGAEAYLIKNGRITEPIKYPVLEIMTPKLYSSIDAIGKKVELHAATCGKGEPMQGIPVFHGGPHIRLRNIIIK